jgi:hypothetical protein
MKEATVSRELAFIAKRQGIDETNILAKAVREGIRVIYQEALIEDYLAGKISRDYALKELGLEKLIEIEFQREAIEKDIKWGLSND